MVFCCSICQERLESPGIDDDSRIAVVKCGHVFHYSCIKTWWLSVYKDLRAEGINDSPATVPCLVCRTPSLTQLFQIDLISSTRDDHLYPTEEEANEIMLLEQNIKEAMARINKAETEKELKDAEILKLEKIKAELEAELAELNKQQDESVSVDQLENVNISPENFFGEPVPGPSRLITQQMEVEAPTNVSQEKESVIESPGKSKSGKKGKRTGRFRTTRKNKSRERRGSTNNNLRSGKNCSMM